MVFTTPSDLTTYSRDNWVLHHDDGEYVRTYYNIPVDVKSYFDFDLVQNDLDFCLIPSVENRIKNMFQNHEKIKYDTECYFDNKLASFCFYPETLDRVRFAIMLNYEDKNIEIMFRISDIELDEKKFDKIAFKYYQLIFN